MGLTAYLICSLGNWSTTGGTLEKALLLFAGIAVGLIVYVIISYLAKNEEMLFLVKMIQRKRHP
jgi:hypothetical protein